jgi:hypothetical protein
MKKPVLFALGITLLSSGTMFAATAIKLLTLGSAVYDDTVKIFGIPVTAIQNDADGFSVEILPGMMLVAVTLGLAVFILATLSNRYTTGESRY